MAGAAGMLLSILCAVPAGLMAFLAMNTVLDTTSEWIDDDVPNYRDNAMFKDPLSWRAVKAAIVTPQVVGVYEPAALITKQALMTILTISPLAVKFSALLFHILNAMLATVFANRLFAVLSGGQTARLEAALAVSLVTAHPLRAEVISWCSCLPYALAATGSLCAALLHLSALEASGASRRLMELASIACLGYAFLCKAAALGAGLFLVFLDVQVWACRRDLIPNERIWNLLRWHGGRVLVNTFAGVMASRADSHFPFPAQPTLSQRVLRAMYGIWFNLRMNLWPQKANNFYAPPETGMRWSNPALVVPALSMVLLSGLPLIYFWRLGREGKLQESRRHLRLLAVWAWWLGYLVVLAPTLGIAGQHLTGSLAHNRFTYIPAFLAFAPALQCIFHAVGQLPGNRLGRIPVVVVVLAALVPLTSHTRAFAAAWNHGKSMGMFVITVEPRLYEHVANKAVARALAFEEYHGHVAKAEKDLRRMTGNYPWHTHGIRNLGRILVKQGKAKEARQVLESYVQSNTDAKAQWWYGIALHMLGEPTEAEFHIQRALELEPTHDAYKDQYTMMYEAAELAFHWK